MIVKTFITNILRVVRKNKLDFFLNLTGLSVAMVVFIFITLFVENECSLEKGETDEMFIIFVVFSR